MEIVMPFFECGPLVLSLELETSYEEENKGGTYGLGPLSTKVLERPGNLEGGKDNLEKEAIEETLEQVEFVLQELVLMSMHLQPQN
jgi:hypothetical protein